MHSVLSQIALDRNILICQQQVQIAKLLREISRLETGNGRRVIAPFQKTTKKHSVENMSAALNRSSMFSGMHCLVTPHKHSATMLPIRKESENRARRASLCKYTRQIWKYSNIERQFQPLLFLEESLLFVWRDGVVGTVLNDTLRWNCCKCSFSCTTVPEC